MKYLLGTEIFDADEISSVETINKDDGSFDGYTLILKAGRRIRIHPEQWEAVIPSVGDIYVVGQDIVTVNEHGVKTVTPANFTILPQDLFYADYKLIEE